MPRRPCLEPGCPNPAEPGESRCQPHARTRQRARNKARGTRTQQGYGPAWRRHAKRTIATYRTTHGDTCPGWQRLPHPIASDQWVCDHDLGPMCRRCNAVKAATHDRARAAARRQ